MARLVSARNAVSTNPLKSSAALGAACAYLGIDGAIPLFHGSQGCTAFALVAMVRHYNEAIPLQTTAMNEISTILGGAEQVEEAIANLRQRARPKFIGIASTALTETRGEDVPGELKLLRGRRPEFDDTAIVYASTPDFVGGLEEGWTRAVEAIIDQLVPDSSDCRHLVHERQVNLLAAGHLTPAEVEELVRLIRAFDLEPIVLPDISTSLDGHVADNWSGTSLGGTTLDDIARMTTSRLTLVTGESLLGAAQRLEDKAGVPFRVFRSLTGLKPVDAFVRTLMELAGTADAPTAIKRERSRLVDGALDAHFHIGGLRTAVGADPDLLFSLASALASVGAEITTAVSTSWTNPVLEAVPAEEVVIGDLGDLERRAFASDAQLLITHAHGRQAAERLDRPLVRAGFPIFDRLGTQDICRVGYRGSRAFLFEIANAVQARAHAPSPEAFGAAPVEQEFEHVRA